MIKEAIILAGGLGTRLRSAVPDLPKCMAPVAGKPFIGYVIQYFRMQGINRFIFSLGYKHEVIEEYLQQQFRDVNYFCSIEEEPLGTGGAIAEAAAHAETDNVLVVNGDTFFAIDVAALSAFHETKNDECTICLKAMKETDRYGVVETDETGRVVSFKEKKYYETSVINGGAYAVNMHLFRAIQFPKKFSFETGYLERYVGQRRIYGLLQTGYFIDIGIPEDYIKAQTELAKK